MQMQQMRQHRCRLRCLYSHRCLWVPLGVPLWVPRLSLGPQAPRPPMMPNAPVNMGLGAQMPSSGVSSAPQQFMYGGFVDPRRMIR
jgi:hypothetical protein